jgi:hypothetical protein
MLVEPAQEQRQSPQVPQHPRNRSCDNSPASPFVVATAATTPNTVPFPKHVPCLINLLPRSGWKFLWNSEFRRAVLLQLLALAFADPPGGELPNPNPHSRWSEPHSRMPEGDRQRQRQQADQPQVREPAARPDAPHQDRRGAEQHSDEGESADDVGRQS